MFENNEDEVYNINDFSDKEIINDILDLNNPTDRELEAKIVMMIEKYSDEKSNSYNEKLSDFFNEIYGRFFDIEDDESDGEDHADTKEGYTDMKSSIKETITKNQKKSSTEDSKTAFYNQMKNTPGSTDMLNNIMTTDASMNGQVSTLTKKSNGQNNVISPFNDDGTVNIRSVDYRRGWLNPLIKETVKRVIYLDSQFRDLNSYPSSTDYTFNLSEPLIDVLSLKLHSINIPYSWYTVPSIYGSNIILLKGVTTGINDGSYDMTISIKPGCYANVSQLITAVNASIQNLSTIYPSVNFTGSSITYDPLTTFATLTIQFVATYNTNRLIFPVSTSAYDSDSNRIQSIPGFLGFTNSEYDSSTLYSNVNYVQTKAQKYTMNNTSQFYINDVFQLYTDIDNSNNVFTVTVKSGENIIDFPVTLKPPLSPFKLSGIPTRYTRDALINLVNDALKNTENLSSESKIELIDSVSSGLMNTYQTYKLKIVLDRNKIMHTDGMEIYIRFPIESDPISIWTGEKSCFMFDLSYTQPFYKPLGTIEAETTPMQMKYIINTSPYILLNCVVDSSYSYRINIPNSSDIGYSKEEYIQVLNDAFITQSTAFDASLNVIIEEDASKNVLHFMVVIFKKIDDNTNLTELDYQFEFYDESGSYVDIMGRNCTSWFFYLGMRKSSYILYDSTYTNLISDYSEFYAEKPIRDVEMVVTDENNTINIDQNGQTIPIVLKNGVYTKATLFNEINTKFSENPYTEGSQITTNIDPITQQSITTVSLRALNTYTQKDYEIIFYDSNDIGSCTTVTTSTKSLVHTTWDSSLGWLLGFRSQYSYYMSSSYYSSGTMPSELTLTSNSAILIGNTGVNVNLINQCFIAMDDFAQNRLNDGVVTMTNADKSIPLPSYSSRATYHCDPTTGLQAPSFKNSLTNSNITQKQLWASQQININQQPTNKYYSDPPFIKDLFALIPIKIPSTQGDSFVEYGGTLQDNDRKYFGPVNIDRLRVQLLTDRGHVIDLNNRNWSFSIVVECKYTANKGDVDDKNTNLR
jgi:hypothetical protein